MKTQEWVIIAVVFVIGYFLFTKLEANQTAAINAAAANQNSGSDFSSVLDDGSDVVNLAGSFF